MPSFTMIQKIKKREIEPKIYAIVVESDRGEGVSLVVAYSLEEAMGLAREDAIKNVGGVPKDYRTRAWSYMTLDELKSRIFDLEIATMPAKETRIKVANELNQLMKEIIDTRNIDLYKKIKGRLTKSQSNYIEEKLSLKKI